MSNYPGAMDSDSTLYVSADNVMSVLQQAVATGDNVIFVASGAGFQPNMLVTINDASVQIATGVSQVTQWEHMLITSVTGQALTVTRGMAGTAARAHASGAVVYAFIDAAHQQALKSAVLQLEYSNQPVANIKGYGAKCDGVADDTAGFKAAMAALPNGKGTIYIPAGTTRLAPDQITIPGGVDVAGAGWDNTTVIPAAAGTTLFRLIGTAGGPNAMTIRNFQIDLRGQPGVNGIDVTIGGGVQLERLWLWGGNYGIRLLNTVSLSHLRNLRIWDFAQAGVYVNGDACAELFYDDVDIARVTAGTSNYGLQFNRTTTSDQGAHYLKRVRVLGAMASSGYISNGIAVTSSTSTDAVMILYMTQIIIEQINGPALNFQKASHAYITNSWISCSHANAPTVQMDGSDNIYITNSRLLNAYAGPIFSFIVGAPAVATSIVSLIGNRFDPNTGVIFNVNSANPPKVITFTNNVGVSTANLTNDLATFRLTTNQFPNPPSFSTWIGSCQVSTGPAGPNDNVIGNIGDLFINIGGGAGVTLFVKESGTGTNTGWVGK
jgi:hypothetical protein